ncbi:MAG: helix-turn-helix domain-containing protein [Treponema sp.]|jgi:transcriptional regulator with XRE-family HTH domain|nr:helix-turn-helix domain-containing protein [Treponema sp.]
MSFRKRLKDEIAYQGLQLKEVAARANISKRTLDTYVDKRERMPAADVAVKLARALNVTTEYLVTGDDGKIENGRALVLYHKYENIIELLEKLDAKDINYVEAMIEGIVEKNQNPENTADNEAYTNRLNHGDRTQDR